MIVNKLHLVSFSVNCMAIIGHDERLYKIDSTKCAEISVVGFVETEFTLYEHYF